jgi:hypothetical protein
VLWYFAHEITPLKPYPDFARYMLPLAALLSILATSLVYELLARRDRLGVAAALTVLVAAIPALWISVRTNSAAQDPRAVVPAIVAATNARVTMDRYTSYEPGPRAVLGDKHQRPTAATSDIVVTSNFAYDRFKDYSASQALAGTAFYQGLDALAHIDVTNGRPSLGYFNPVLRIVALDGRVDRLSEIAEAIRAAAPTFDVRLVVPNSDSRL